MAAPRTLRMAIGSSLDNVALVGSALRGVLENEPGPREDIPLVELAVCEAVNNAIIHAYSRRDGFTVEVTVTFSGGRMTVTVMDQGRSFEKFPAILPRVPDMDDLDQVPLSGWGLRILGEVMDRVDYRSENGSNELILSRPWTD